MEPPGLEVVYLGIPDAQYRLTALKYPACVAFGRTDGNKMLDLMDWPSDLHPSAAFSMFLWKKDLSVLIIVQWHLLV